MKVEAVEAAVSNSVLVGGISELQVGLYCQDRCSVSRKNDFKCISVKRLHVIRDFLHNWGN